MCVANRGQLPDVQQRPPGFRGIVLGPALHHPPEHPDCRVRRLPRCSLRVVHCVLEQRSSLYLQRRGVDDLRLPNCTESGQSQPLASSRAARWTLHVYTSLAGVPPRGQCSAARSGRRHSGRGIYRIQGLPPGDERRITPRIASRGDQGSGIVSAAPVLLVTHHADSRHPSRPTPTTTPPPPAPAAPRRFSSTVRRSAPTSPIQRPPT